MEPQLEVARVKGFANGTVPFPPEDEVELHGEFRAAHMLTFMIISRCYSPVVQIALRSRRERLDASHQAWRFILSAYQAIDDMYIEQLEQNSPQSSFRRQATLPQRSRIDSRGSSGSQAEVVAETSSTKDVDSSSGKGRGDGEASCSMVGVVESTVSLAPEVGEDFQAVEAAVQANPMAVLLNSGFSHHLMGTKAVFVDMAPSGSVKHVHGFNGALRPVEGRRTVALQGEAGKRVFIPDVLYVLGVQVNLLSAGQLKESGVQLQGDGAEMLLIAAIGEVLDQARYTGRVLCTDLRPCSMRSLSTDVVALQTIASVRKSTPNRWHARLTHVGFDTIKSSAKHEVATGLDINSDAEEALADVQIDLCGPFRVAAKDGSLYILLLKDLHTRFVWVVPIAKKSEMLQEFEKWLVLLERHTKKSVLMFRSDRGGEFLGKAFTNFDDRKGIIQDLTCLDTPQQNGMAEWEMRTVVDSVRTMLQHMELHLYAAHCVVYSGVAYMGYHACLPPAAFTTVYDDAGGDLLYDVAKDDVDLPELNPDTHAVPEHRWDIATMTVKEALASWKVEAVKATMYEEIRSLIGMGTWELVKRPRRMSIMKNQWVLTTKYRIDDTVERKKARLDVKGFMQVYGTDYNETYSVVSSYVTPRIFFSIVVVLDFNLMQLDMKNAFLQSKLDQVYQPDYFDNGTGWVCKLLKSLYQLKQVPLLWYRALDGVLLGASWKKSQVDAALYFKVGDNGVNYWVLVYVNDLLAASSTTTILKELKELLEAAFKLCEISPVKKSGLEIVRDRPARKLWLHQ
ncbi:unnamed protein product [Closterium sp. NIES-54]